MRRPRGNQRGFTLVELMAAVLIAVVIIVAGDDDDGRDIESCQCRE